MSAPEARQLTREELYAQVWAKPVAHLAKEWGLSDVGLAKLCRWHAIPLPYRGYWARKDAGQTPRPIPLPAQRRGIPATVWLDPKPVPPPKPIDPEIEKALADDAPFAAQDRVPDDLRRVDKAVSRTRAALQGVRVDDFGRVSPRWDAEGPIKINVSRPLVQRALRIAQGIIQGAVRRGYTLSAPEKEKTAEILVRGNGFGFSIEEPSKRFETKPDPKNPDRYQPRFRYEPRGQLVLRLMRWSCVINHWADSETGKVEECLPKFFRDLAEAAIEQERSNAESKLREERWRAADLLRAEYTAASKQAVELTTRIDDADGLRRMLARFEAEGVDMSKPVGEYGSWREWLLELTRVTDPLADIRSGKIRLGRPSA